MLTGDSVTFFGRDANPRNFVANEDVARFAVLALTDSRALNQTIDIAGPENLTALQIAAIYSRVVGRELTIKRMPLLLPRALSLLMRPFHSGLSAAMHLAVLADTVPEPFDPAPTLKQYPLTLTRLEDWVRAQQQRLL